MIPLTPFMGRCLLLLVSSCPMLANDSAWWNKAWSYRQHIGINTTSISEDLNDFPVWVRLSDAQFARTLAGDSGQDLRAIGADGESLELEMVSWVPDDVRLYVRVPKIKAGAPDQGFDLYFGNPNATAMRAKSIWNKSYLAVLHLAGDVKDATGGKPVIVKQGFVVQNGWTDGLVMDQSHRWLTFDNGHRGYLEITPKSDRSIGPGLTLVGRFRPTKAESLTLFSGPEFEVFIKGNRLFFRSGTAELSLDGVKTGHWQSVAFTHNPATGMCLMALDGSRFAGTTLSRTGLAPGRIRIGRGISDEKTTQYAGDLEEFRLLGVASSDAWIKATTLNLSEGNPWIVPGTVRQTGNKPAPPSPPQLLAPSDDSRSYKPAGIGLRWLPSTGATEYEVLTFKDAQGRKPLKIIPAGTSTAFDLTADQAGASDIYWTIAAKSPHGETRSRKNFHLTFHHDDDLHASAPRQAIAPQLTRATNLEVRLQGYLGGRIDRLAQYMIDFTQQSPGLLRMQRERPEKGPPAWAGVFAGQYLSSAQLVWRLTHNPELKAHTNAYVRKLTATQRADGYMGPFESIEGSLELWNHYATLCGLLDYYEDTENQSALEAARKVADLVIKAYGPAGNVVPKTGGASESISHAIVRLYRATRDPRYLEMANYLIHEVWNEPGGVALYKLGQGHPSVSDFPVRRWESVHNMMALSEMYWITGDDSYRNAFGRLWQTLRQTERHITGGFSTNEGLLGTPFNSGTIETCCTVAWSLLSTDMLRLSGDSNVADELEWTALNSALGSIPFDGTCSTYATQPDGYRQFCTLTRQGPRDGIALSCCSTNAARALGNIANWAMMQIKDGLVLNFYGPSMISADLPSGNRIGLSQVTQYPAQGDIRLNISARKPEMFTLFLRIPIWSKNTQVMLNGEALPEPQCGSYLPIRRQWSTGDTLTLSLDFTPRYQTGAEDYAGKVSVFRGPILFSSDARYDPDQVERPVPLTLNGLKIKPVESSDDPGPWILAQMTDSSGKQLIVCDFSSAGLFGDKYMSWFDLKK